MSQECWWDATPVPEPEPVEASEPEPAPPRPARRDTQVTWCDATPLKKGKPVPPTPEPEQPPKPPKSRYTCECGRKWGAIRPAAERCDRPRCGALLCSICGHSEGRHAGDWARSKVRCLSERCDCEGFASEVLRRMDG